MNTIILTIISIAAMGLFCAILLAIISKVMHVDVDDRVLALRSCLPGVNCGACGYSGCEQYAVALVDGEVEPHLCTPGGDEVLAQICSILNVPVTGTVEKKIAIVQCMGDSQSNRKKMDYVGIETCFAAKQLYGGVGACSFGCVGLGDCVKVCPSAAICIKSDLARVDLRSCTGCGLCVEACPTGIMIIEGATAKTAVLCRNTEKGAVLKNKCTKGCTGCTLCVKACPQEAITVDNSLAYIDYTKCDNCKKCMDVCRQGCIVYNDI